jgi:hypothetical protein
MHAKGLLALRQAAIGPRLVNRDLDSVAQRLGNVINVAIPSAIAARAVTPSVVMNSNVAIAPTKAVVTLDHWMEAPFEASDTDLSSVLGDTFFPMQASEAIKSLGNDADTYLLGKHIGLYSFSGAAGSTASTLGTFANARKLLNKQLAPMDERFGLLDPDAESAFLQVANIIESDKRGDQAGIVSGTIGTKLGLQWYMDQNAPSYTPGTAWVTGWTVNATTSYAAGVTGFGITFTSASGTIKVGDIFTVGAQSYAITSAVAAAGSQQAVSFYPALATGVSSGATLAILGTSYVVNIAAHRDCFAWASRPLAGMVADGHIFEAGVDPISGIALRLEFSRQYKLGTFSYDYLAGANVVRPELGTKILG